MNDWYPGFGWCGFALCLGARPVRAEMSMLLMEEIDQGPKLLDLAKT